MQFEWNDETVERLRALFDQGLSMATIGRELGVTRSAVIGKIYRLKWNRETSPHRTKNLGGRPTRTFARRKPAPKQSSAEQRERAQAVYLQIKTKLSGVPDEVGVKLIDIENHHCRYPVGEVTDQEFGFCGKDKIPGTSYCLAHLIRCYEPRQAKRIEIAQAGMIRTNRILEDAE